MRNDIRVQLHLRHPFAESEHQFLIESVLNNLYLLFGSSDFLLVGFEFVGYITLGVDESLFSDPLGWHLFFVCVTHLKVIAEYIIVSYFKALNTSPFYLALLYLEQVFLPVGLNSAQFVEFGIDSPCDDIRPSLCQWRVRHYLPFDAAPHLGAGVELLSHETQKRVVFCFFAYILNRRNSPECAS